MASGKLAHCCLAQDGGTSLSGGWGQAWEGMRQGAKGLGLGSGASGVLSHPLLPAQGWSSLPSSQPGPVPFPQLLSASPRARCCPVSSATDYLTFAPLRAARRL